MKRAIAATVVVAVIAFVGFLLRRPARSQSDSVTVGGSSAPQTFEEKLVVLSSFGLRLSSDFSVDDLLESWGRDQFESPGFDLVIVSLGSTEERPPWRPHCQSLWHFDTECIEGHGSYVAIANRMASMAGTSLPLENIEDYVDIQTSKAWLRFRYRGEEFTIPCAVDNDWVDPKVFGHFVRLLARSDSDKLFLCYDLGGQDCVLGCVTRKQYDALKKPLPKLQPLT
jgi:hypothetical protein